MAQPIAVLALASIFCWQTAMAAEPAGDAETLLTFHESAATSLAPDLLSVALRSEANGSNPARLQQDVNDAVGKAVARAKATGEITVATGGYFVSDIITETNGRPHEWRATQTLTLSSKRFERLLQLTGELQQDGLLMSGMNFELSAEARQSVHDRLVGEAMAAVRREAGTVASAMNMRVLGYKALRLGETARPPVFRAMAMAPMAKTTAIPPTAEGAQMPVEVEVDAEVRLGQP